MKVNFTKLQRLEDNDSQGTYFFDANTFTGVGTSTPYAATINTAAVQAVTANNTEVGAFVQDDWRPDDHWQVSAGLRWDYESDATNENFVTPAGHCRRAQGLSGLGGGRYQSQRLHLDGP